MCLEYFEDVYKPSKLQNWQIPKRCSKKPCAHKGKTCIISNDRGHLLPDVPRDRSNIWGEHVNTWNLPKKISRQLANELSAPKAEKLAKWKKRYNKHKNLSDQNNTLLIPKDEHASLNNPKEKDEINKNQDFEVSEQNKNMETHKESLTENEERVHKAYTPGDLTDPQHCHASYRDLKSRIFEEHIQTNKPNGYPKYRDDFFVPILEESADLRTAVDNMYKTHKEMMNCKCVEERKKPKSLPSPYLAAASNFILAKKLAKENLEHEPLPDTITDAMYRKRQMMGDEEPGLLLKDGNYATGVGWKGYPGYGATRCTKLKVYRPKSSVNVEKSEHDRPNSVSSFDKKWRFIRQKKVTPIELAICWDLTPINRNDEPKPPTHIDGSNGSQAPAVFSLVHTPKDNEIENVSTTKSIVPLFDKVNGQENEHKCHSKDYKSAWKLEHPICSSSHKSNSSNSSGIKRAKSAYNIDHHSCVENHSKSSTISSSKKQYKSSPNLTKISNSYKYCSKECSKHKFPNVRLCVACEMKNVKLKERPKSEFKMAFKAGVPNNNKSVSSNNALNRKLLKIPKQRDPYSSKNYIINSLAPPFSLQSGKRHEYPDHWRLASIYQHSYKPLHLRKRPMIESIFK